jgi:hypothetical protein
MLLSVSVPTPVNLHYQIPVPDLWLLISTSIETAGDRDNDSTFATATLRSQFINLCRRKISVVKIARIINKF